MSFLSRVRAELALPDTAASPAAAQPGTPGRPTNSAIGRSSNHGFGSSPAGGSPARPFGYNIGSPTLAPTPRSSRVRRLRNEENPLADEDSERDAKRLKRFASDLLKRSSLPHNSLDGFLELDVKFMMVDIKVELLAGKVDKAAMEARLKIDSKDFKNALKDRLSTCLLLPDTPHYVTDLSDKVLETIRENSDAFELDRIIVDKTELWNPFSELVRDSLADLRSSMKTKIQGSTEPSGKRQTPQSIQQLSRALLPSGTKVTPKHLARFSFLRQCWLGWLTRMSNGDAAQPPPSTRDSDGDTDSTGGEGEPSGEGGPQDDANPTLAPETRNYKPTQFWTYVDDQLEALRERISALRLPAAAENKVWTKAFTECIKEDLKAFPPPTAPQIPEDLASKPLDWQAAIRHSLLK